MACLDALKVYLTLMVLLPAILTAYVLAAGSELPKVASATAATTIRVGVQPKTVERPKGADSKLAEAKGPTTASVFGLARALNETSGADERCRMPAATTTTTTSLPLPTTGAALSKPPRKTKSKSQPVPICPKSQADVVTSLQQNYRLCADRRTGAIKSAARARISALKALSVADAIARRIAKGKGNGGKNVEAIGTTVNGQGYGGKVNGDISSGNDVNGRGKGSGNAVANGKGKVGGAKTRRIDSAKGNGGSSSKSGNGGGRKGSRGNGKKSGNGSDNLASSNLVALNYLPGSRRG